MLSGEGEPVVGDRQIEVLGHLVPVEHSADGHADLGRAASKGRVLRVTLAAILARSRSVAASRSSRLRARSRASIGVAADDQPLAGKVGRGDRRQVALVEQRHLQMAAADQLLERGGASRRDPVEAGRAQILVDARLRDHAAIADQHDVVDGEAVLQLAHLIGHGGGIAGVSREHLDRDGTSVGRAEKAIDDLQLVALAVAV